MCNCAGLKLVINIMKKTNLKYFKIDIKIESNVDHSEPADLIYFSVEEMGPFWSTRFIRLLRQFYYLQSKVTKKI